MSNLHYDILPRLLSVQSHVVSGYVGNRASVFPLQILGFDVDFINSVQFANHTGYPSFQGQTLSGNELSELQQGLAKNYLLGYDYVLTGYIGSESFLKAVLTLVESVKKENPGALYVCDPVLGDHGKYYVPKELVQVYLELLIPQAYMITPNQFEAELLSKRKITCEKEALEAITSLSSMGPNIVVLTSCELDEFPGKLCCYCVCVTAGKEKYKVVRIFIEKVTAKLTGTGDVFAALIVGWIRILGVEKLEKALLNTISTVQAMIQKTIHRPSLAVDGEEPDSVKARAIAARNCEMAVVAARKDIEVPPPQSFQSQSWEIPRV